MKFRSKDSPEINKPARGTKCLDESVHKDDENAVATVLSKLANDIKSLPPLQISRGYLNHSISHEDNRAQITIEFYDRNKGDADLISELKRAHPPQAIGSKVTEDTSSVSRKVIKLPQGRDQDDVVLLLERAAENLVAMGRVDVLDLLLETSVDDDGVDWPYLIVYYKGN